MHTLQLQHNRAGTCTRETARLCHVCMPIASCERLLPTAMVFRHLRGLFGTVQASLRRQCATAVAFGSRDIPCKQSYTIHHCLLAIYLQCSFLHIPFSQNIASSHAGCRSLWTLFGADSVGAHVSAAKCPAAPFISVPRQQLLEYIHEVSHHQHLNVHSQ